MPSQTVTEIKSKMTIGLIIAVLLALGLLILEYFLLAKHVIPMISELFSVPSAYAMNEGHSLKRVISQTGLTMQIVGETLSPLLAAALVLRIGYPECPKQ